MSQTIYHDFKINAPIEEVFRAISDPKHLINWWPLKCTGIPQINEEYNLNFTDTYNWYGKVVRFEANKVFYIKMIASNKDWNHTTFGFELQESASGVKVMFSHTGWIACSDEFKYSSFCWAILLNGLRDYVENGIVIPFEDRE